MHGELRDELGDMLRGEKFPAGLARIGGIVRDQEFIGIAEQINLVVVEVSKI
jgi:hypothetical protein